MELYAIIFAFLLAVVGALVWVSSAMGEGKAKRKEAEREVEILERHAEIDQRPDVDGPFGRMRKG